MGFRRSLRWSDRFPSPNWRSLARFATALFAGAHQLAQIGGGLFYKLGDSLSLVFSSNLQAAAPAFTLNLDVNLGVGFSF